MEKVKEIVKKHLLIIVQAWLLIKLKFIHICIYIHIEYICIGMCVCISIFILCGLK